MKLLFIQGGSRVRCSKNGACYVDGNFNNDIWKRYKNYCDELTIVLRRCSEIFEENEISSKFNKIDTKILKLQLVDDIYLPRLNFFNVKKKIQIKEIIKNEVKNADKVIIRSIGNFYTNTALKYCKKYKKSYLIEVTGFAFEGLWYHSLLGKISAIPREIKLKRSIRKSPYAVYVTNKSLQKRYPCNGQSIGCSDVEIQNFDEDLLNNRITKIENYNENHIYKLGTAAFMNVKWKGQQDVIKALYELKKIGITNFEYELIGAGDTTFLKELIKKYNLDHQVKILGVRRHEEVFEWMDNVDIYIQPSYQEGLCRAIIEAMSRACPVIASDTGGNPELIDCEFIFKKGNIKELKTILKKKITKENLKMQSNLNFNNSKLYEKELLDLRRNEFYEKFIKNLGE